MNLKMLFMLSAAILPLSSCTLSAQSASPWHPYTFNGQEFIEGEIKGLQPLWLRDGFTPRLEKPDKAAEDNRRLPPKSGAVAGICYLQTSGGKIANQSGITPLADEQITINSMREGAFVTRTDADGLFIETLDPGEYVFSCRGAGSQAEVKTGETTLIRIRGGKRMAD